MRKIQSNKRPSILGMSIDTTSYDEVCQLIINWQANHESKMVCFANVHMVMTAYDSKVFRSMVNQADLVTPDGMPLVWTLRQMGYEDQQRVYGPTLTIKLLKLVEEHQIPIGFFGSTQEVINNLKNNIYEKHPNINIVYTYSPPFQDLDDAEMHLISSEINQAGARILFVGLGCPKQEIWMHDNKNSIQAVMLGVGAAFDFIAGNKRQAPHWIQRIGMEWFYRLMTEPKRLWKRYFYNNPRFIIFTLMERIKSKYN